MLTEIVGLGFGVLGGYRALTEVAGNQHWEDLLYSPNATLQSPEAEKGPINFHKPGHTMTEIGTWKVKNGI